MRYSLVILGAPVSSTNSSRILRSRAGRPFVLKSAAAMRWQKSAISQLTAAVDWHHGEMIHCPLAVTLRVYRKRKSGDLDNFAKAALDALQRSGWIANDRQVVELHMYRADDATNPRIELTLDTEPNDGTR